MKKIAFFILAAFLALVVLSKLPNTAQAKVFNVPSPTPAPVASAS